MAKKPKAKAEKPTKYTATDGVLFLELKTGEHGRYTVTSPFVPGLVTEAKTLEQAFKMAHDAVAIDRICCSDGELVLVHNGDCERAIDRRVVARVHLEVDIHVCASREAVLGVGGDGAGARSRWSRRLWK